MGTSNTEELAVAKRLREIGATSLWAPYTCSCPCRCGIKHRREGKCVWCQKGDCWWSLDRYLAALPAKAKRLGLRR
jgi:hypothetical protein